MFLVFFGICDFFYNLVCVRCAYFCPTYIEGGVLSCIYGWIAFAGFITFLVNFYYICGLYYILVNCCLCGLAYEALYDVNIKPCNGFITR